MPRNWEHRDKKLEKRKNGMKVDNRSIYVMRDANIKRNRRKVDEHRSSERY
jgi:hypothetical protein